MDASAEMGKKNIELPSLKFDYIYFSLVNALAHGTLCQHIDLHIRLMATYIIMGEEPCNH